MKRRKVWVGLGTAVLVTSQVAAHEEPGVGSGAVRSAPPLKVAQHSGHATAVAAKAASTGGEGDEGGAAQKDYDANLAPDLRFHRNIELIRGHLLVGDELVRERRWAEALPHFLHPSEEIYGKIREDLKTYGVAPFAAALKSLAQTVKAKNEGAYRAALAAVEERLAAADKGLRAKEQNWSAHTVDTVLEVLRNAGNEYEEAVEGGRIGKPVEYQDSRGFVWQAEKLLNSVADDLARKDAEAVKAAQASFAELKKAWPTPVPPKQPVKDHGQVLADISKVELQLGRFR
jgi:hypothetical protein